MKEYILMIDTETTKVDENKQVYGCNSLVYDLGCAIVDRNGVIYETLDLVVGDIFYGEEEKMQLAYYSDKLPQYHDDIKHRKRKIVTCLQAQKMVLELMKKYKCKKVGAYNTSFDYYSLKTTTKWCGGKWEFFPKDTKYIDVYAMSKDIFYTNKRYKKFCKEHGYLTLTEMPQVKAETVYRYIKKDITFVESHTGLQDVLIETEIMAYINQRKQKVKREIIFKK